MEQPLENTTSDIYVPMDSLNSDILHQLGNIRLLMGSKNYCEQIEGGYRNILGDESDWMMAEKNKPRSPLVSPAWSRTFDFKTPEKDSTMKINHRVDLQESPNENDSRISQRQFQTKYRSPENDHRLVDEDMHKTSSLYKDDLYSGHQRIHKAKRQLFCRSETENPGNTRGPESDRMSQLLSFIASTSRNTTQPSSPVLQSVQPLNNHQPSISSNHQANHTLCACSHNNDTNDSASKRRKLDHTSVPDIKENIPNKSPCCTCTMMEEHFLQMAQTAYKNIRRKDTSPASFEQFKRELTQTNDILKESVDIVNTIREMCEHRKSCITTKLKQ